MPAAPALLPSYRRLCRCLLPGLCAIMLLSFAGAADPAPPKLRKTLGGAADVGRVCCLAFSPDGKSLLSGSLNGSLRLWDSKTGEDTTVAQFKRPVEPVAFQPSGKSFAASCGGVIGLWDARTRKGPAWLPGEVEVITSLAFTPDGKTLAAACYDERDGEQTHTLELWDVDARKRRAVLAGHGGTIFGVSVSPDGKTLASASMDGTVRLWDVKTGKHTATLEAPGGVHSVSFSPDGRSLATARGGADDVVRLWDVKSRKVRFELKGHNNGVTCLAFMPDGKTLVSGSFDTHVRLWDVKTGKNTATLRDHKDEVLCIAVSPDGKTLATGSSDKTIMLWDLAPAK